MRSRRYARHALHDIEHCALDLQQTQLLAIDLESDIARFHMIAVMQELLEPALGVEIVNDLFRHLYTGKYSRVLNNQLLTTHLGRRYTTERGMITVADILFKPNSNKLTKFFFFHINSKILCKDTLFFAYVKIFL